MDDAVFLITERLNAAEKLVGDGKKLLQRCLKKNKLGNFVDGQQKSEPGQKRKNESKNEKKKKRKDILDSRNC